MTQKRKILITGGAGFIGSHLVDYLVEQGFHVVVLDKLTYAGDVNNISKAQETGRVEFFHGDICNAELVLRLLRTHNIGTIFHLAAESHVDNSIHDPDTFVITNVLGTLSMLKAAHTYWTETAQMDCARFVHVSTDEVFGHLSENDPPFYEETPYKPNSPYSASKASSDHFVRAWFTTFGLPVITTNCSNNFGMRQHDEKLIPTIIRNALNEQPIPIYGTGQNVRDWLYVKTHCQGLYLALTKGKVGESYAFGTKNEMRNIDIAKMLCRLLDREVPRSNGEPYEDLISFVEDRKGHDWRYAINTDKVEKELGFSVANDFEIEFLETARYYIAKYRESDVPTMVEEDLRNVQSINFADADLTYESFRQLAQNQYISENERVGFPDSYRQGFIADIVKDIIFKLDLQEKQRTNFLDIGCGASALTFEILKVCKKYSINAVLVDSPEMLENVEKSFIYSQVPGKFPDIFDDIMVQSPKGYQSILCYSVLHYIIHNIFDFIDAICLSLAPGGIALIGDIPNQSKRNRFFSTETGIAFHKNFMKTIAAPQVDHYKIQRDTIDESVLNALIERTRANGCHGYLLPQPNTLPMFNRRDDLLIQRV